MQTDFLWDTAGSWAGCSNVRNAEELEHFKQRLAIVTEGNGTVVRVALLNQDMAVETAHLGNGEDGDAAERPRCNG